VTERAFLDTNVLLRFLIQDDDVQAAKAEALLERIDREEEQVLLSPLVVSELVFTLLNRYRQPKAAVVSNVRRLIRMRAVELSDKQIFLDALTLWGSGGYSFGDAFNATYALARGVTRVYSWDHDYDRIDGVTRLEPGAL
jgi:predicted nucleic acid-binding protein